MQEIRVQCLDWEDPLEEEMATHPSIPTWRIPWTEEPGGLQSTGSQKEPDMTERLALLLLLLFMLIRIKECQFFFKLSFISISLFFFLMKFFTGNRSMWSQTWNTLLKIRQMIPYNHLKQIINSFAFRVQLSRHFYLHCSQKEFLNYQYHMMFGRGKK